MNRFRLPLGGVVGDRPRIVVEFPMLYSGLPEPALPGVTRPKSLACGRVSIAVSGAGCRLGEALGLMWQDIADDRATFWITKSGRSRTAPLTARARNAIDAPKNGGSGPFANLTQPGFRAVWNDARAEIGLSGDTQVAPHILRHTCASRLARGGIDIRRVQMWLGHRTLSMTMRYAHLATSDLDACVKALERAD